MNWVAIVFILLATLILFSACARVLQLQEFAKSAKALNQWSTMRLLMLIGLLGYLVVLFIAITDQTVTLANLSAIVLTLGSVVTAALVNFFFAVVAGLKEQKKTASTQSPKKQAPAEQDKEIK